MPLLDRTGLKADLWRGADSLGEDAGRRLVPFADLPSALAAGGGNGLVGVEIANTVTREQLAPYLPQLALIAIRFPSFSDGRGFSLARQLRAGGFVGTLRAVGPLIADQFVQALACGFDEVEPPEETLARQPVSQWLTALTAIGGHYQSGLSLGPGILERRRASREVRHV